MWLAPMVHKGSPRSCFRAESLPVSQDNEAENKGPVSRRRDAMRGSEIGLKGSRRRLVGHGEEPDLPRPWLGSIPWLPKGFGVGGECVREEAQLWLGIHKLKAGPRREPLGHPQGTGLQPTLTAPSLHPHQATCIHRDTTTRGCWVGPGIEPASHRGCSGSSPWCHG